MNKSRQKSSGRSTAARPSTAGPSRPDAVGRFLAVFQDRADETFLLDARTGRTGTYAETGAAARAAALELRALGVRRGDRVALSLDNSFSFVELFLGVLYAGAVAVPLHPTFSRFKAGDILRACRAKAILVSPDLMCPAIAESGTRVVTVRPDDKGTDWPTRAAGPRGEAGLVPCEGVGEDDELAIVFTSGTTSEPKGIGHTYRDFVTNAALLSERAGLGPDSRFLGLLPMTYLGGHYNLLLIPFLCGSSLVVTDVFDAKGAIRFWRPVMEHGVNTLWLVPTIISILLEFDRGPEGPRYCRKVRPTVLCGTAPLPAKHKSAFEERYGIPILENYGLSETLFLTSDGPAEPGQRTGVGPLLPGIAARIVDRHDADLSPGAEGEILARTPCLARGYYDIRKGDLSPLSKEDWFATGDLGIMDCRGTLSITGRKKDLIIRGGINISPSAIEEALSAHPAVLRCAVVGIPHRLLGEDVAAVLRLPPDTTLEEVKPKLREVCEKALPAIYRPAAYFELPELPQTTTGKIQKNKIRAWLAEKLQEDAAARGRPGAPHLDARINAARFFAPSKVVAESVQAMSIKYNNRVYEMQRRGADITVLSLGEAFFDIPLYPFDDLPFPAGYHYSHSRGIPDLREKLAEYFREQYDVSFDPELQIIITAGSKAAIHMSLMSLLNPGDEVLIHEPAWVSYPEQVKLCYGVPVMIPHDKNVFHFEEYVTNRTKAVIINNPNNPSGKVFNVEEISHLCMLAEKYKLFILSDEAYSDFLLDGERFVSAGNIDKGLQHTVICNSMSKNYGMSGWRVGYCITNPALTDQILKVNQHLLTCPATILEHYLAKHFHDIIRITKPQIAKVVRQRAEIAKRLDAIGLRSLPGTATFYFFVSIAPSSLSSEEFCTRLLDHDHVCVVPGLGYGRSCDKFVRVSVGTESLERIYRGLDKIKALIDATKA
ncbi:MAG: aminotransferase class I/II-fold pyridoxal phosphate-dependent enzyme [Elusimicrobia bacterium]|nr:aminotransferase class I/II-fold pyridoxal phosphate-dependent enzyme [Elusimicrobiota bacterium]